MTPPHSKALRATVLFLVMAFPSVAQISVPKTPAPTPAAAALMGDLPVTLASGSVGVEVPLLEVQGRTLSVPISVRHHGGAVRPTDPASWVGLGWTLSAGGSITRVVRDKPDDQTGGYASNGVNIMKRYDRDALTDPTALNAPEYSVNPFAQLSATGFGQLTSSGVDLEPDVYFYSIPGRSGTFYVDPRTSTYFTVPASDVRITATGSPVTTWILTTEDGTTYTFGASGGNTWTDRTEVAGVTHTSTWHLAKIGMPAGADAVSFTYSAERVVEEHGPVAQQQITITGSNGSTSCPAGLSTFLPVSKHYTRELVTIETDVQRATFVSGTREDLNHQLSGAAQGVRLDRVELDVRPAGGTFVRDRSVRFSYDYFLGATGQSGLVTTGISAPDQGKRLKLTQVQEFGADNATALPATVFEYFTGALLSRHNTNVDYWGYPPGGRRTRRSCRPTPTPS